MFIMNREFYKEWDNDDTACQLAFVEINNFPEPMMLVSP